MNWIKTSDLDFLKAMSPSDLTRSFWDDALNRTNEEMIKTSMGCLCDYIDVRDGKIVARGIVREKKEEEGIRLFNKYKFLKVKLL